MNKNDLTIIIPCFNMEKYIAKCLDSIFNQTYKNYNIIVVDDASTDDTYNILKEYETNHDNMLIIENKVNSGAGYSRNQALSLIKTKYVTFVDGDDYLSNDYYENFMAEIKPIDADIGLCDIYITYEEHNMIDTIATCCEGKLTKYNFIVNGLAASPCNKVFKTELFNNNSFAENIINEDIPAVLSALIKSDKLVYIPNTYYYYVQHKTSVQNSSLSIKKLDLFKSIDMLYDRVKDYDYKTYWDGIIFYQIILLLLYIIPKEKNYKKRKKFLFEFIKLARKYNINHNTYLPKFLDDQSFKHKLYYRLLINLVSHNHIITANNLIWMYKYYKENYTENVLASPDTYNIDTLISLAKQQEYLVKKDLTVVIPNYNYARFLYQRLFSILNQDIAVKEIIILDDKSKDNSITVIDSIVSALEPYIQIRKAYNEENSGSAFKQWEKGIKMATGKYIWICEADDYCNRFFLKDIFKKLKKDVVLAYTDTGFINVDGLLMQRSVVKDIDLQKSKHWNKSFVNDGNKEIIDYAYLNCTIANVSSVVFKNMNFDKTFTKISQYKQAGDWLFYLDIMQHGKVAYINKVLNYYRIHGSNATTLNKKQLQYDEIKRIHDAISKQIKLDENHAKNIIHRHEYLEEKWKVK